MTEQHELIVTTTQLNDEVQSLHDRIETLSNFLMGKITYLPDGVAKTRTKPIWEDVPAIQAKREQ